MQKRITLQQGCALIMVFYVLSTVLFYFVGGDRLHFKHTETDMIEPRSFIGEFIEGAVLEQPFVLNEQEMTGLTLQVATFERSNTGSIIIEIKDSDTLLAQTELDVSKFKDNSKVQVVFEKPIKGQFKKQLTLLLRTKNSAPGNAITLFYGNGTSVGKASIQLHIDEDAKARYNGETLDGVLSWQVRGRTYLWFGSYYWHMMSAVGVLLALYFAHLIRCKRLGKRCYGLNIIAMMIRYEFLLQQLVSRDFKTKYKRSVLGVLWSFLNPLLTMLVQYVVFSTLFKSSINNFPLYLLTGIICFNFFNEASSMSLMSIVGNTSLITKVYVPKYIYPLARVLSSTINLLLSLIPLIFVIIFTGTPITPAFILLPFGIVCLFAFALGIGLTLASSMVFFRDTQFLWGVISMLWMYATPIFYPESIIPQQYMAFYKMNPLYHIIRFLREILMQGVSPEPKAYLLCLVASFVPLAIGAALFKKTQNRFILYI